MESNEAIREMRKCPRYPVDARARISYSKEGYLQRVNVRAVDIGINGVAVSSPLVLPEGEHVEFEIALPGNKAPMRVKAVVRNKKGQRYGIEFISTTDLQKDDITRYGNQRGPISGVGPALPAPAHLPS